MIIRVYDKSFERLEELRKWCREYISSRFWQQKYVYITKLKSRRNPNSYLSKDQSQEKELFNPESCPAPRYGMNRLSLEDDF